jgi:hypothetical protein
VVAAFAPATWVLNSPQFFLQPTTENTTETPKIYANLMKSKDSIGM